MKKFRDYFIVGGISTLILSVLFLYFGIYPFGRNTVLTGDLYTQVSALFYHLWDSFLGNGSLLVDYTSGAGENFFGIFAYYLVSPINLVILLFKRNDIYLAISLVVALKIILSAITCLYSLKYIFKKDNLMFIPLSLLYAFSGYTLVCYQITSWMDVVYMFPLIVVGLKKLIDEDKPIMYGITLFLTICFSFYLSYIMIIFIFILAFIYIKNNVDKKRQKMVMLNMGIYTLLPMIMSLFITYPALKQIFGSARTNISKNIFNNLLGCLFDKLNYFNISILLVVFTILLIINKDKNKKFLKWYIPALLVLVIPYIVEPLNKVFHFMSYSFFPNRYGFILFYLLVIGGAYFFNKEKSIKLGNKLDEKIKVILGVLSVILLMGIYFITFKFIYKDLEAAVYSISMIYAKKAFIILSLLSIVIVCVCLFLNIFREEKSYKVLMYIVVISNICFNTFLYIGLRDYQGMISDSFKTLVEIENKDSSNYYKLKTDIQNIDDFVVNDGIVSNYQTLDHFTSLVNRNSVEFYKNLGYSSFWTMIFSSGGTLFSDSLLANKYFLTDRDIDSEFYTLKNSKYGYNFYELNNDRGYGFISSYNFELDNNDTFSYQNNIYKAITGNDLLFSVYDINNIKNIDVTKNKSIIKSNDNYIEYDINIKDKCVLYLDLALTMDESIKGSISNAMLIYINDQLYKNNYPTKTSNGIYDLGVYENQNVNIKIKLIKPIDITKLTVGSMDINKYLEFVNDKSDLNIKFEKNKITIDSNTLKDGYLVIPISYSDNYNVLVNGIDTSVTKMFGGLLGVKVSKGHNTITYTYHNKDLEKSLIVSLIATFMFILVSFGYKKINTNRVLGEVAYYTYSLLFYIVSVLYVGIILVWLVKFII